jgi:uncharacterized protein YjbI with pentapeptide repeats
MSMDFTGKWSIKAKDTGSKYVTLADAAAGNLSIVQLDKPGEMQFFNTYEDGTKPGMSWLQASNGKYLTFAANEYTAALARDAQPVYFSCEDAGKGWVRIVDHGPDVTAANLYYWNRKDGKLERIQKNGTPPDTTLFQKIQTTPGLKEIKESKPAAYYNLNWVYMSGADLSRVIFFYCQMEHVDLSNALMPGVTITDTTLKEANLYKAILSKAVISNSENLAKSNWSGADLTDATLFKLTFGEGVKMVGTKFKEATASNCDFSNVNLTNADFTGASLSFLIICGTNFTGAILNQKDFTSSKIDKHTNFKGAQMQEVVLRKLVLNDINFSGADMTGAILDGASLENANMSSVILTRASLTEGVKLSRATLSNATLTGADLTGAQLGAKIIAFNLDKQYKDDKDDLDKKIISQGIKDVFKNNRHTLSDSAKVTIRKPGVEWLIDDEPNQKQYDIKNQNPGNDFIVYIYSEKDDAANLAFAYMENTILSQANLCAVNLASVCWYGSSAKADYADLEEADLSNAYLEEINFSQASMYGCNLDFAVLLNAHLSNAMLTSAANLKQASFVGASLQGTNFTDAQLADAVLTNAAVSLDVSSVPLFVLDKAGDFIPDLDKAKIPNNLRSAFNRYKYFKLIEAATVTVVTRGSQWNINNNNSKTNTYPPAGYLTYSIKKINNDQDTQLQVYGSNWLMVTHRTENSEITKKRAFNTTLLNEKAMNGETVGPSGQKMQDYINKDITWEQFMTAYYPKSTS